MTDRRIRRLRRQLQEARHRLVNREPELAAPLTEIVFVAHPEVCRISTNGRCIYFDANWLEKLGGDSLDFALCHQLMHLRMGHLSRPQLYRGDRFHVACNIVANSALIPYGFTADRLPGIGEIRHETFYPKAEGRDLTPYEAFAMMPLDPAGLSESQRRSLLTDSDEWWDRPRAGVEGGVVVLSPADPDPEDLSLSPQVRETVERSLRSWRRQFMPEVPHPEADEAVEDEEPVFEYAARPTPDLRETLRELRSARDRDAAAYGVLCERVLRRANLPANDWRALLNQFLMDETRDYSFTPPDRRTQELEFFLPDYNEAETPRLRVLFMVDISASVTEGEVAMAVGEICAAIEQFGGMLDGSIGFFDTAVRRVIPIRRTEDLLWQAPLSGGGTDFRCVFDYAAEQTGDCSPSEIVVMTDGKGDFPEYEVSRGIPVLWLLSSNRIRVPWGQAAHFRQ